MEILEAILAFLKENKELTLIFVPIIVSVLFSSVITYFMTSSFRNKDKKDDNAKNFRAELREYFLTNCKPIINELLKGQEQNLKKRIFKQCATGEPMVPEYFTDYIMLINKLFATFTPLISFVKNKSHRVYKNRFNNYFYIINYITILYKDFIFRQTMFAQVLPELNKYSFDKIMPLITYIDYILAQSELILFNSDFDNDAFIFQNYIDTLDKAVLDTGLDNAEDFLFNREALEELLESCENKTTETV